MKGNALFDKLLPCQCRAARALLDWTQAELAENAGLCRSTVRDFESGRHIPHQANLDKLAAALELGGVGFLFGEAGGIGVQLLAGIATGAAGRRGRDSRFQLPAAMSWDPGKGVPPGIGCG